MEKAVQIVNEFYNRAADYLNLCGDAGFRFNSGDGSITSFGTIPEEFHRRVVGNIGWTIGVDQHISAGGKLDLEGLVEDTEALVVDTEKLRKALSDNTIKEA